MKQQMDHTDLISEIEKYCVNEGRVHTLIPSLKFFTTAEETDAQSVVYEPSLCIALRGEKAVGFGDNMYSYNPLKYLLTCTNVPVDIKIKKCSKELPYIGLVIRFTLEEIYEVIKDSKKASQNKSQKIQAPLCFNKLDERLLEPIYRMIKLLDKKQETIDFMAPLIKKEIIYTLIENDEEFLKNYVLEGTLANQIVKVISEIKNNFNEPINIGKISRRMGMSEATLYQNFKKITLMSPLQFQKKIRLAEAKQMLLSQNLQAHEVAFNVGYESASQFSREYSRMYGMSPKAHSKYLRGLN